MRAYEFARKNGIDYGSVVQLAEANDIEVYSPLTQFEDDELEALHAAYLRADRSSFADAAAVIAEKRRNRLQPPSLNTCPMCGGCHPTKSAGCRRRRNIS